ncbi:hypothetical protein P7K49_021017 [Saguinus oedipus]|uniref:Uncharacterized protein n=1 Tax=Saguinus oedipus TaxID=9490 RepID=A0ABQ9US55_SAGOE|nr:hypothetical protein P7K49_021017 [Saguinus oedipus]
MIHQKLNIALHIKPFTAKLDQETPQPSSLLPGPDVRDNLDGRLGGPGLPDVLLHGQEAGTEKPAYSGGYVDNRSESASSPYAALRLPTAIRTPALPEALT